MSLTTVRSGQPPFRDRTDAGVQLAFALSSVLADVDPRDVVVLGLARGGVPVAAEIARAFGTTLDACTIRKIRAPDQPELAIGAVGPWHTRVLNESLIRDLGLAPATVQELTNRASDELDRIDQMLRGDTAPTRLTDKVAILVDDGLATGASMRVALNAVGRQRPKRTMVAVPVAAREVASAFRKSGVESVLLIEAERFHAVSHWYQDFTPVPIDTVRRLLASEPGAEATPHPSG